jgi:hypothetical protein
MCGNSNIQGNTNTFNVGVKKRKKKENTLETSMFRFGP